ncbi:2-aminoethanethiol dioxygenase-like [Ceratina calcarata]|uniref:2-aminoethanethiol dioxygenase-like n=1 Tax=Ceratina calcarata TaxID=156304 RepID=A0AAJ7IS05_9HYME|nr:2-aminoethanethiol dioxygenase-like [Ceratina calcarata]XP_017875151.1 2-aminoethanethiol dioxygenase-like [Ceratina calcarata]XP_017875152.1 2-aminoethanethiol dioxygenase-like [Ceratina calcarata]XP_017885804.1 2-aminoethanethiol dioxygenase-like [Ceratina calcarata]
MTAAIKTLWKQALNTFEERTSSGFKLCQKKFDKLRNLMNKITAEDVNLNKQILDFIQVQHAPMWVIDIFQNQDFAISIFILKHGFTMPIHDHPGMYGFLKVISGVVQVNNYTLKANEDHTIRLNKEEMAYRHKPITLHSNSPACTLTPKEKNLHEITCIEGPAAFLDILSPPYDVDIDSGKGPRPCRFFKTVSSSKACTDTSDIIEEVKLVVIEGQPDFYSGSLKYTGPPLM